MNGEIGNGKQEIEVDVDVDDDVELADPADTIVMSDDSVELNVDELVASVEVKDAPAHKKEVHRRLEELEEKRREEEELDSTYNFDLNDDLT